MSVSMLMGAFQPDVLVLFLTHFAAAAPAPRDDTSPTATMRPCTCLSCRPGSEWRRQSGRLPTTPRLRCEAMWSRTRWTGGRRSAYHDVDIVWDHVSRVPQLYAISRAPCDMQLKLCSTKYCPCLLDADLCLQSDVTSAGRQHATEFHHRGGRADRRWDSVAKATQGRGWVSTCHVPRPTPLPRGAMCSC